MRATGYAKEAAGSGAAREGHTVQTGGQRTLACTRLSSSATLRTLPPCHHTQARLSPPTEELPVTCLLSGKDSKHHTSTAVVCANGRRRSNLRGGATGGWTRGALCAPHV